MALRSVCILNWWVSCYWREQPYQIDSECFHPELWVRVCCYSSWLFSACMLLPGWKKFSNGIFFSHVYTISNSYVLVWPDCNSSINLLLLFAEMAGTSTSSPANTCSVTYFISTSHSRSDFSQFIEPVLRTEYHYSNCSPCTTTISRSNTIS